MSEYGIEIIEKRLKEKLINELTRTGLLFRLFSRVKEQSSIDEKFARKTYSIDTELMQDLVGFRITTYFSDDVKIVVDLCEKVFGKVELIYDEPSSEVFKPLRKNMICRMPTYETSVFEEMKPNNPQYGLIDNTFEIQFRTTLSEGWHEVDHLMRYKCKPDWECLTTESRMLNGIYATLETNDQALKALFDDISYQHYKSKKWEAMLRNKLRLRFLLKELDTEIISYLDTNIEVGKKIFKLNRNKMLNTYINSTLAFPITFDNWLYFINYCFLKDEFITSKIQPVLKDEFELAFNSQENN
jgi:ppGpp synthetase/RelA/SpoT-type nucleotidyltranferase